MDPIDREGHVLQAEAHLLLRLEEDALRHLQLRGRGAGGEHGAVALEPVRQRLEERGVDLVRVRVGVGVRLGLALGLGLGLGLGFGFGFEERRVDRGVRRAEADHAQDVQVEELEEAVGLLDARRRLPPRGAPALRGYGYG